MKSYGRSSHGFTACFQGAKTTKDAETFQKCAERQNFSDQSQLGLSGQQRGVRGHRVTRLYTHGSVEKRRGILVKQKASFINQNI